MLLFVAVVWGSAFVAQRIAAPQMGIFTFNGLRFLLAGIVLLPAAFHNRLKLKELDRKSLAGILLAGILLWGGATLQHAGLRSTTAANAGFITGLYVVLVPIILAVLFKRRSSPLIWSSAILAVVGLFLLSTGGKFRVNIGDILEMGGAFFWAFHVILIGWLVKRVNIYHLAVGQYLICGALGLAAGLLLERNSAIISSVLWWSVLYTGLISVALGYTLQAYGQRTAPPTDAAIILSAEAVFAALFGWLILSESLTTIQLIGCAVILSSILLSQFGTFKAHRYETRL